MILNTRDRTQKLANDIRTKIYGKEVREALATGIEESGNTSQEARDITENLLDGSYDSGLLNTEIEQRMEGLYSSKGQAMDELYMEKDTALTNLYTTEKAELDALQLDYSERAGTLEETYAPRLTEVTAQLAQTTQAIDRQLTDKVDKNGSEQISMAMLNPDIKQALNDGEWNVNVNTSDIENGAVTGPKLNEEVGLFKKIYPNLTVGSISPEGVWEQSSGDRGATEQYIPVAKGDSLVFKGKLNPDSLLRMVYYNKDRSFLELLPADSSTFYGQQSSDRTFKINHDGFVRHTLYKHKAPILSPEEITELQNSIYINKNKLKALPEPEDFYAYEYSELVIGSISPSDKWESSYRRASTKHFVPVRKGETLVLKKEPAGTRLRIMNYDTNKQFISVSPSSGIFYGSQQDDRYFNINHDGFIRYTMHMPNNRLLNDEDLINLKNAVYIIQNKLNHVTPSNAGTLSVGDSYSEVTIPIPLEYHGIDKTEGLVMTTFGLTGEENFETMKRTGKYLRVFPSTTVKLDFQNSRTYVFEYDKNFNYIRHEELNNDQEYRLNSNTHLIKFSFEEITNNLDVKLTYVTNNGAPEWVYNDNKHNRPDRGFRVNTFVYETATNQGRTIENPVIDDSQYSDTKYFNTAILKLPPNYDPYGDPVKLIIYCQGSGGYLRFNDGLIDSAYESYLNYLLDEGYAVLGVYRKTTKYVHLSPANQNLYANPLTIAAINSAYKHVVKNYNISKDGVFVSGKSSGGYDGGNLSYGKGIPVLATGLLSPTFNSLSRPLGSHQEARYIVAKEFGFEGDYSVLDNNEGGIYPNYTEELVQFMKANVRKMTGYNPSWNGLIGVDVEDLAEKELRNPHSGAQFNYEERKNEIRIIKNPMKIWYAEDDGINQIPTQAKLYERSINNAQGDIEIRCMPNGTGGHNSVDSSPDALRVDLTTSLGIERTDIPLAYVEMVQYFRRFEN